MTGIRHAEDRCRLAPRAPVVWVPVLCAVLCCACTRQIESAYRSQHRNAVSTVVTRQIENAVDAGSGDPEMHALRQRLAANAGDMNARITLARLYAKRGFPDLAMEHYRLAILQDPDALVAVLELAKTLRQMEQTEGALAVVQFYTMRHPWTSAKQDADKKAEDQKSESKPGAASPGWEAASLEGVLEDELGHFGPAEEAHRFALKIEPNRASLHNNLGYNLLLQNKPEAAAEEFRAALKLDSHSEIARNNLGAALAMLAPPAGSAQPAKRTKKGKPDPTQALADWERGMDPAVAHNNLAAFLMEQGRFPEARAELQAALEANPGFAPALENLKLLSESDGRPITAGELAGGARPKRVNFWKRAASSIVGADAPASKPAVSAPKAQESPAAAASGSGVQ